MRWTAAALLRPVTFVLAIVAGVVVGNETDSFWLGLLGFFVAFATGRVVGALVRGRADRALYRAVWPAAAAGFGVLFDRLGLPTWATFLVATIAATMTKSAVPKPLAWRRVDWRRIDLDELLP